jgi:fumarate reductase subunit D
MKKSTKEQPGASEIENKDDTYQVPLLWEMFTMEGGMSLIIIFPLVVLFFLKMAYESV